MRKKLLFLPFIAILLTFSTLKAQNVPNGSFESWIQKTYKMPDVVPPASGIFSSNSQTYLETGVLSVTEVQGVSGSAIRIETTTKGTDTIPGYFGYGQDPQDGAGGVPVFPGGFPFTDKNVTGVKADIRYNISSSSPGLLLVQFKKNGVPIGGSAMTPGLYAFPIQGQVNIFTSQTFPIVPALTQTPDTVVVGFVSNNPFDDTNRGLPGNFIEVDNLQFTGTSETIPGGNFDTWKNIPPVDVLAGGWQVFDQFGNNKSSVAYQGSTAIKITTSVTPTDTSVGVLALGQMRGNNMSTNYYPGMAVNSMPYSLIFNYNYSGVSDSGLAFIIATKYDPSTKKSNQIGYGQMKLGNTGGGYKTGYALLGGMPFVTPDSIIIEFYSSSYDPNMKPKNGSTLIVDAVSLNYCQSLVINGPYSVCTGTQGVVYSVDTTQGSTYSWTVPSGSNIVAGNNTDKITVDFGATQGNITLTKTFIDGCTNTNVIQPISFTTPSANGGLDKVICSNNSAVLPGSVQGATGGIWTTSGTGTFLPSNTSLIATYKPSAADAATGSVTVTLTTTGTGACSPTSDNVGITIKTAPTISAGPDKTICSDAPNVSLNATKTGATGVMWSGAGSFAPNTTTATVTYTASGSEISGGQAWAIVETTGHDAACSPAKDTVKITIMMPPSVDAGPDASICQGGTTTLSGSYANVAGAVWSTDGTGSFDDATKANAIYTPSAADTADGSIYLTLTGNGGCRAITDKLLLIIEDKPIVNAGADMMVCSTDVAVLHGSVYNASGAVWSNGNGTFLPGTTNVDVTYTPSQSEINAGFVKLALRSTGNGNCLAVTDSILITISVCTGTKTAMASEVKVYPNPTSGMTTIETDLNNISNVTVLNNVQQVVAENVTSVNGKISVDLSSQNSGVYYVVIETLDNRRIIKMIMKQ